MLMKNPQIGKVTLVGAGPGDPELLTMKALKAIQHADVIVHDRLVSPAVLAHAPEHVRKISVGKQPGHHSVPQEQINELLVSLAFQGLNVTRLKGGDPLIFGRGGEELEALREAGIACSCIPGITAAQGAAASLQLPLTHRGLATGIRYVTGHRAANASLNLDWASLASAETTLAVYMGASTIGEITQALMDHGLSATTPVLAITSATTPHESRMRSSLGKIAVAMADQNSGEPVLFIIGNVAALVELHEPAAAFMECAKAPNAYAPT